MPKYAVVRENRVSAIIVASSLQSAEKLVKGSCIEVTSSDDIGQNYTFDGTKWNKPVLNNIPLEEN